MSSRCPIVDRARQHPPASSRLRSICGVGVLALVAFYFYVSQRRRELQRHPLGRRRHPGVAILGLNIVTGYSGQISIGHSAFFGIGAYTTVILSPITAGRSC